MKAFELLADPKNWKKEAGNFLKLPCCIVVAIASVYCPDRQKGDELTETFKDKYLKIKEHLGITCTLGEWNDAPERTHEDVINVLKELDI